MVDNSSPAILIADDDRDFRETMRDVFQPRGFRTLLAANGEEALEIVHQSSIHLVLMDMHMPKLTGLEAIDRIKELNATLPCILISAALNDEIREKAKAFSILSKPVSFKEITHTVSYALKETYNWPDEQLQF